MLGDGQKEYDHDHDNEAHEVRVYSDWDRKSWILMGSVRLNVG